MPVNFGSGCSHGNKKMRFSTMKCQTSLVQTYILLSETGSCAHTHTHITDRNSITAITTENCSWTAVTQMRYSTVELNMTNSRTSPTVTSYLGRQRICQSCRRWQKQVLAMVLMWYFNSYWAMVKVKSKIMNTAYWLDSLGTNFYQQLSQIRTWSKLDQFSQH